MLWSILIASHATRVVQLSELVRTLDAQLVDTVEVVVLWNRGAKSIGEYRQALLEDAHGEYVSFVDDDDRVSEHYVSVILEAIENRPDYIGFKVAVADLSERPISPKYRQYTANHSLRYDRWHQKNDQFYRHVSHLNPIRRELALRGLFDGKRGEDHAWADQVRPFVKTETWVEDTLYFYDFCQERSIRSAHPVATKTTRPVLPERFRFHPDSEV